MNNLLGKALEGFVDEPDDSSDDEPLPSEPYDEESPKQKQPVMPDYMDHFFRDVDNIKVDIEGVRSATKQIHELHEQSLSATTAAEESEVSKRLQPLIQATNQKAKRTKTLLGLLKEETTKLEQEETLNTSDIRVRQNLMTTLTKKFVDDMKIYQQAQQAYKSEIQNKAKRQIHAIQPDMSPEEIETVMKTEGGREQLMKQTVLSNSVNDQVQTAYSKVAGKFQDVLTLEQSVAELHQMFLDFALLTEQQGELLDTIEFQVSQANDYVETANEETFQAIEYQKSIRKKQCWIMAVAGGATMVLALVIFG